MLKQRVLTAIPLAALVLAVVWLLPGIWLQGLFAVAALIAAWEWAGLSGLEGVVERLVYLVVLGGLLIGLSTIDAAASQAWLIPGLLWWLAIAVWVLAQARRGECYRLPSWLAALAGLITLALAWLGIVAIHSLPVSGPFWVTVLMVLVWGADIGAYFAGRRFGKHKLAAAISPGKTWEGVMGGLALGLLVAVVLQLAAAPQLPGLPGLGWLLPVAAMVIALSVIGDLAESVLKRQADRKDSGQLLPGHGGMLDRIDALLAAAPVLAAALMRVG
ncbi:phosphatidate cytidylyltransferase [Spiribacter insolitus]|uniref:Phosphatidate cytidylyltransferase n=1 Tax=Spiribacter insolitus TaxID=3122417 RepID=A0ABV3T740_9GAMM